MSNDEELIIKGRIATDYADAKRKNALLGAERERVGRLLVEIGRHFERDQIVPLTEEHFAVVDMDKLRALLADSAENKSRLVGLQEKIRDLGLD